MLMDAPNQEFVRAASLEELEAKGGLVVHGPHRPILVVYDRGRVFALDNRCPHMGFPLERGSVEDGILTCHWHHARFDLESGCTFDLWADDIPACPVEVRNGDVWVKTTFGHPDPARHWRERLYNGLAHDIGLVIANAVHGELAADVPPADIVRQVALFGTQNRDGWGVGLTTLTALANLLPMLPEEEIYLAVFHGVRCVAADCDGQAPRRARAPLGSRPDSPHTPIRNTKRRNTHTHARRTVVMAGMDGKANSSYSGPRGQVRFAAPSGPEEQGYLWASGGLS
jgi:nitrite reductase/ring-hydroxylating ferredoxin subunit